MEMPYSEWLRTSMEAGVLEPAQLCKLPEKVLQYQREQNVRIGELLELSTKLPHAADAHEVCEQPAAAARAVVRASIFANVAMLCAKCVAYIASDSLVVLASALDSLLDLASGGVLYASQRALDADAQPKQRELYPQGQSRIEPVGVMVFSVVMAMVSLNLAGEGVKDLVAGVSGSESSREAVVASALVIGILTSTVVIKLALYVVCSSLVARHGTVSAGYGAVAAYADDHRNDSFSNTFGLGALLIAARGPAGAWVADPLGAILIAAVLFSSWVATGLEQMRLLIGRSAPNVFLNKLAYVALAADERVLALDTIRAYNFGSRFLVELDIVLDPEMPLQVAHDIGQELQDQIEGFAEVERAFVHIDWETSHNIEHQGSPSVARSTFHDPEEKVPDDEAPLLMATAFSSLSKNRRSGSQAKLN